MTRYRVLGPLAVLGDDGAPAAIRGSRQRTLLAALLAHRGSVTTDLLLRALWDDDPPDTAVAQLHTLMWRLRRVLGDAAVVTSASGYELVTGPDDVDAEVFRRAARRGRELLDAGAAADAVPELAAALGLWRGPVLADVDVPGAAAPLAELTELRLTALRDHGEALLATGRHHEAVPLLRARVEEHPLREELRGQLMVALCRCGRQAEALRAYREGRQAIVDELGLEPGAALQAVHDAILAGDPDLVAAAGLPVDGAADEPAPVVRAAQLPAAVPDLTGRDDVVRELVAALRGDRDGRDGSGPRLVVVSGAAGTGKTAVAVHAAHAVADAYPDGQLFADLRGVSGALDPGRVMARFLRALGDDPRALPDDLDERAAAFRARTAGLRLLVVLDDAAGEAQLRPLLPAGPGCAVLVTSRRRLPLPGADAVDLGVLDEDAAAQLLRAITGAAADDPAVGDVVRRCGLLPLAIRIAGARLAARPHWTVARLAEQLADEGGRLDALEAGDVGVRSSLELSHRGLGDDERRALRLVACLDAPDVGAWVVGPLLGVDAARAADVVDALVDARLLDVRGSGQAARFALHDLVRAYGRERSAADDADDERDAALRRAFGAWLALAEAAGDGLDAGFRRIGPGDAPRCAVDGVTPDADWLEAERLALVATVRQAARRGDHAHARDLACALARFFELREHLDDWETTHDAALAAVRAAGDRRGEAHVLRGRGELRLDLDRYDDALADLHAALAILDALGERDGRQHVLRAIGTALRLQGREADAATRLADARRAADDVGDALVAAQALHGLGVLHRRSGRLAAAERHHRDALAAFARLGDRFGEAYVLCSLGLLLAGEPGTRDEAERHLRRSVELCRDAGYRRGEALARGHLGDLHIRAGRHAAAAAELREGLAVCREVGERPGEAIMLRRLGQLHADLREHDAARSLLTHAGRLADQLGLADERAAVTEALATL